MAQQSNAQTAEDGFDSPMQTVANAALMSALANQDFEERCRAIEHAVNIADPDALLELVADQTDARRRNAAMEVLERAGARSVPALVKALKSSDEELVMFAATVLGKTRAPSAVPHLLKLLSHSDTNVIVAAVDSLGQLRARAAVRPIMGLLDADPWLRFSAAHALGDIGDPEPVDRMVSLLSDPMLHDILLSALGRIGSLSALPTLAELLRASCEQSAFEPVLCAVAQVLRRQPDRSPLTGIPSWEALKPHTETQFRQHLATALTGSSGGDDRLEIKRAAAQVVCALRVEALYPDLVRAAEEHELDEVLRYCVLDLGGRIGPAVTAGLLSPDAAVRAFSCTCVGTLNLRRAVPHVLVALDDVDVNVRAAAIRTLAHLHTIDAIPQIVGALRDVSPQVRDAAKHALAHMDAVAVGAALLQPQPSSLEGTLMVLDVLAMNPQAGTQAFLNACVAHPNPEIRSRTVRVLSRLPGFEHSGFPERLLADASLEVRLETLKALRNPHRLTLQSMLLGFVERDPALRAEAIRSLAGTGDSMIAAQITQALLSHPETCDATVAEAVAVLEAPVCAPLLVRWLGAADPSVRRAALIGIERSGSRVAMTHAAVAVQDADPEVRLAAVDTLAAARDLESLERLVMDPDARVAKSARRRLEDLLAVS